MEHNKDEDKKIPLEEEPSIASPKNYTEETGLKSDIKSNNNDSLNMSNNNSYMQLDTNINLNINNNNNINNTNNNSRPLTFRHVNIATITRKKQLAIFIPMVSIKILTPVFFMLKYIIYCFENEEDQNYCKYSVLVLTFQIFLCYFLSIFTPANQTNVDKYFDKVNNILTIKAENPGNELQNLNVTHWDDCLICNSKKFIRSSHCRTCNKCILFRDHHCPYIGSCVGFNNMQYFFNFLFWAFLGLIFYVTSSIKFYFSHYKKRIPRYLKVYYYFDLISTCFFIFNIFAIMFKLFLNIYNNRTQLENIRTNIVEYYYPFCKKCGRDFSRFNIKPEINFYNIGFLANLYYIIGPTPFHFIFPLPKYNNYILNENCPIFKKTKRPERLDLFKYMVKKDFNNINMLNNEESSPTAYINACHKYYDGKKII